MEPVLPGQPKTERERCLVTRYQARPGDLLCWLFSRRWSCVIEAFEEVSFARRMMIQSRKVEKSKLYEPN
ncbi:hypothetical protein BC937DRAFT_89631 [Endogone sp. FLAS-F59071]|nr:hypothetical protein BC937DRAFT_90750 [Endogone sp. FLAS-F59071]RUS17677.1 hypothetical protein BC937DRAFT_89631 [Endogone sp. FLAS-F59071]|eukprot:RUS16830.1 hypothetical protein BC937DRAFT_90750 [Endogone sp. FLAS-F59071]